MFLNQRAAEFSFFYTKRSSLDLYIQTCQDLAAKQLLIFHKCLGAYLGSFSHNSYADF